MPRASVVESRWEVLPPHDCFVTAGNSYGLMSAGIDAVVVRELGPSIEQAVQLHILNTYPPNWERVVRCEQLISGTTPNSSRD